MDLTRNVVTLTDRHRSLFEENLPLARWLTRRFLGKTHEDSGDRRDDIYSAAMHGLLNAATHHDPRKHGAFSAYAGKWIRCAMRKREYQNESGATERSQNRARLSRRVHVHSAPGRSQPNSRATRCDRTNERIKADVFSLDGFPDHHADPIESVDLADETQVMLGRLRKDHRQVLELRYFEGLSHAEIATRVGKCRRTVFRLLDDAREAARCQEAN